MAKAPRVGAKMAKLLTFVHLNPGCTMMSAAAHVGPYGSLRYGYQVISRALSSGMVVRVERSEKKGCYSLYVHGAEE